MWQELVEVWREGAEWVCGLRLIRRRLMKGLLSQGTTRMDEGLTGSRGVEGRVRSGGMRAARAGAREENVGLLAGMKTREWCCRAWLGMVKERRRRIEGRRGEEGNGPETVRMIRGCGGKVGEIGEIWQI